MIRIAFFRCFSLLLLCLACTAESARAIPPKPWQIAPKKPLFERIGGLETVRAAVDQLVALSVGDPRVKNFFITTVNDERRLAAFKKNMTEDLCHALKGPCKYTGKSMREAHKGLRISAKEFAAYLEDVDKAFATVHVPAGDRKEILSILHAVRGDVTGIHATPTATPTVTPTP